MFRIKDFLSDQNNYRTCAHDRDRPYVAIVNRSPLKTFKSSHIVEFGIVKLSVKIRRMKKSLI